MEMNNIAVHRRGRLNLPDNIRMVYLWMHSGGFNPIAVRLSPLTLK